MINLLNNIDYFDNDTITIHDIYDVIYGGLLYYKNNNFFLVKKNDKITLYEKKDIDIDKIVCLIYIKQNKYVFIEYESYKKKIELKYNVNNDKFNIFILFRSTFDKFLKKKL